MELEADIQAFLLASAPGHAQCLFPARWYWLKQQLAISTKHDVTCPKLESWLRRVSSKTLTLIFPVMYLDNPGSSFGHTFLRFDDDSVLLSYALNYAADIDHEDSFPVYAYKGLFGGYDGVFNTRYYFETVQLYTDIENRDIWEYQLDYTPEQIKQLARRVWEVTGIRFDYYFFRENCSYRLLALLDAVKPEAALTSGDAFPIYAIPVDTVRALEERNLIRHKQYRPSLASQLKTGFARQDTEEKALVLQLADSQQPVAEIIPILEQQADRVRVLEQAYTLLQFRAEADGQRGGEILAVRSRLPHRAEADSAIEVAHTEAPENGHASARIALGGGRQNQQAFVDLLFRPAFHDLLDSPRGYVGGSEIRAFDTRLRWFPDEERLLLESLEFISIVSLSPVTEWYTPLSWQVDAKLERIRMNNTGSDMAFVGRGGGGYSMRWAGSTLFAMLLLEASISSEYAHDYSLLAGAQLGASMVFAAGQALLMLESDEAFSGFELGKDSVSVELQFNLVTNTALRAGYRKTHYDRFDDEDWFVRVQLYF